MDSELLQLVKGVSPLEVIIIVGLTYVFLRKLRSDQKTDVIEAVRAQLGLREGERFDDKLREAIEEGFGAAVHPLTLSVQGLGSQIVEARTELHGLRESLTNHGERLAILEIEVGSLTTQVSGPTATHAFRGRIDRRKEAAAARLERGVEEGKK